MEKSESTKFCGVSGVAGPRLLVAVLGLGLGSVLGGALLAPFVHGVLVSFGREYASLAGLRDLTFERVVSRTVLALMVLGLAPTLRWGQVREFSDLALPPFRVGGRGLAVSFAVGLAMVIPILFGGWILGAYHPKAGGWMLSAIAFLPAALLVGLMEEIVFRGALFRSMRDMGGMWGAAMVSSMMFSAVHFAAPEPTIGIAHAHWYSGLQLLPDTFRSIHAGYHYFPFMLNLFLMGVGLCLVVERTANLYTAIGLHAGWIWAMRTGNLLVLRDPERLPFVFGWDNRLATGYAATAIMALLILGLVVGSPRSGAAPSS